MQHRKPLCDSMTIWSCSVTEVLYVFDQSWLMSFTRPRPWRRTEEQRWESTRRQRYGCAHDLHPLACHSKSTSAAIPSLVGGQRTAVTGCFGKRTPMAVTGLLLSEGKSTVYCVRFQHVEGLFGLTCVERDSVSNYIHIQLRRDDNAYSFWRHLFHHVEIVLLDVVSSHVLPIRLEQSIGPPQSFCKRNLRLDSSGSKVRTSDDAEHSAPCSDAVTSKRVERLRRTLPSSLGARSHLGLRPSRGRCCRYILGSESKIIGMNDCATFSMPAFGPRAGYKCAAPPDSAEDEI